MRCDKCNEPIAEGEERSLYGRVLCEDCYMDTLSPARTCDPWAVHSAKTMKGPPDVNERQTEILKILKEEGAIEPARLAERLNVKAADLEREIASLRHMEKVRGELREGRKYLRLW